MDLFERCVDEIEHAYEALGHTLGWRFLSSPRRTLAPDTPLLLLGLNPGDSEYHAPLPSSEEGNAYRTERWGSNGSYNPLQRQVCTLFERLAEKLPGWSRDALMDATLTANFCPFRSPSWQKFPRRQESLAFSTLLWRLILQYVQPRAILTFGDVPFQHLWMLLVHAGAREVARLDPLVGWGDRTYSEARLQLGDRETVLVGLPHLSRCRIIGRPEPNPAVEQFLSSIAAHISAQAQLSS